MTMYLSRLKELREQYNLKQEDVANILGVARTTYAMYEQGNREMDYELLIKLANHYKVSTDYILGRTNLPIHNESYSDDEVEFMTKSLELYKEMKEKILWKHISKLNGMCFLFPLTNFIIHEPLFFFQEHLYC